MFLSEFQIENIENKTHEKPQFNIKKKSVKRKLRLKIKNKHRASISQTNKTTTKS